MDKILIILMVSFIFFITFSVSYFYENIERNTPINIAKKELFKTVNKGNASNEELMEKMIDYIKARHRTVQN